MDLQRFAFSTSAYSRHSLKKSLKRIARMGFKGVEILADKPHVWLDSFHPKDVVKLHKQLEHLDLFVSNINANSASGFWTDAPPEPSFEPSLISRNKTLREWRIAYTKKAMRFGRELGAQSISITSGRTLNGVPPEKAAKYLEEGLARLIEEAENLGLRLAMACEPGLFVEYTAELMALLARFDSPYFGASLGLGHADVMREDPRQAIRTLQGRIFNLHLQDILGHKHYHRVPGEGELDFRGIFRDLDEMGYTGPLTWNLDTFDEAPDDACERTYGYLKNLLLEMALVAKPGAEKQPQPKRSTQRIVKPGGEPKKEGNP